TERLEVSMQYSPANRVVQRSVASDLFLAGRQSMLGLPADVATGATLERRPSLMAAESNGGWV
ncbi:MAG: hypothetical protein ACR2NU_11790, partial [Aeoliella sp.]